jgi:carbonic anhydrase
MDHVKRILANNRRWAAEMVRTDPEFFASRAGKQEPHFLFIGCSDSRVPAEAMTGVLPGEMFVHRNVANQVLPADLNVLAALEFAVGVLHVEHVIVCGHYGCGGVVAAAGTAPLGLVDHWLGSLRTVIRLHRPELDAIGDPEARHRRLVDLNVIEQVYNLSRTPIVQQAWSRARRPLLHGLVYDMHDGILGELVLGVDGEDKAAALARGLTSRTA